MLRFRFPFRRPAIVLAALVLVVAAAGGTYAATRALEGQLPQRQLINSGRPGNAPGEVFELVQVTIPPGATIAPHSHPGMQIILIESGSVQYAVIRGAIRVRRVALADGTAGPVEVVRAGRTVEIAAGDSFIETRGMIHSVVNGGTVPAVILASSLFDTDEPANIPAS